jgi:predicted ATP-dependent protease
MEIKDRVSTSSTLGNDRSRGGIVYHERNVSLAKNESENIVMIIKRYKVHRIVIIMSKL